MSGVSRTEWSGVSVDEVGAHLCVRPCEGERGGLPRSLRGLAMTDKGKGQGGRAAVGSGPYIINNARAFFMGLFDR